jgi:hypothetical protein
LICVNRVSEADDLWRLVLKHFVIRQNIEHYRAMLPVTTNPAQRPQIEKLLHEEEAKLKQYDDDKKLPGSSKTA